jgi:hypothetical protein
LLNKLLSVHKTSVNLYCKSVLKYEISAYGLMQASCKSHKNNKRTGIIDLQFPPSRFNFWTGVLSFAILSCFSRDLYSSTHMTKHKVFASLHKQSSTEAKCSQNYCLYQFPGDVCVTVNSLTYFPQCYIC